MEVKGTAVRSIPEFVKKTFPEKYADWLNSLSAEAKKLFIDGVRSNEWYGIKEAAIVPTEAIGRMFFEGDTKKGAWESGRYSAEVSLNGVYKLYVKASSPGHIISRAGRVFSAYYQPSTMATAKHQDKSVTIHITEFFEPSPIIEYRIGGWMEKALEISGCKEVNVEITKSLAKGEQYTEYYITWE